MPGRSSLLVASVVMAVCVVLAAGMPVRADGGTPEATVTASPDSTFDYSAYLGSEASTTSAQPSAGSVLMGLAWKLGLVVALAYGALWVLRRFVAVKAVRGGQQLQVLETVSLGSNRSLHLLKIGSKTLLVGATAQEVRTLADVSQDLAWPREPEWDESAVLLAEDGSVGGELPRGKPSLSPAYEAVKNIRRLWNGRVP